MHSDKIRYILYRKIALNFCEYIELDVRAWWSKYRDINFELGGLQGGIE